MKTMKNFAAQQLTKKQMNEVRGGANCQGGTHEVSCRTYIEGMKGYYSDTRCATSGSAAAQQIKSFYAEHNVKADAICM